MPPTLESETVLKSNGQTDLLTTSNRRLDIACRAFYAFVGLNAVFVATLGLWSPTRLASTFTWLVLPPLHARFVGVLYLFGAVYLFCCALARRTSHTDPALSAVAIFTAILGILTFLHLNAFNFGKAPSWIWTVAYVVFPVGALILIWLTRRFPRSAVAADTQLLGWERSFLLVQAGTFGVAGVLLFVVPTIMVDAWPWKVTSILAQSYSCAFLAFAWCSLRYAYRNRAGDLPVFLPAMLVLTGGTLATSLYHHGLFPVSRAATWLWFGAFGVFFAGLVGIAVATMMNRGHSPQLGLSNPVV